MRNLYFKSLIFSFLFYFPCCAVNGGNSKLFDERIFCNHGKFKIKKVRRASTPCRERRKVQPRRTKPVCKFRSAKWAKNK